jgi:hypothetical protein
VTLALLAAGRLLRPPVEALRTMTSRLSIVIASAAAALTLWPATGLAAAPQSLSTPCGRVSGPTLHRNGQALSHYIVGAFHGTTCSFARTWVKKIVSETTPNGSISRLKGPPGWSCIARTERHTAFNGSCRSGLKSFTWGAI